MWQGPASALIEQGEAGWAGLWSLLDAGGHAALSLSLAVPLGVGVDLAFAAIELGEARDELEWTREELAARAPVRLGPLHIGDSVDDARRIVERMVEVAMDQALALGDEATSPEELACLTRVLRKLRAAEHEFNRTST
jgi:hypothetical protein